MILELKIALRFLKYGKTQTLFILLGIAVGVSVQIFLSTLITSLQDGLIDDTIGNAAHITIKSRDDEIGRILEQGSQELSLLRGNRTALEKGLINWPVIAEELEKEQEITAFSPLVQGTALIRSSGKDLSVQVKGIQLSNGDKIYELTTRILSGEAIAEGNQILIGKKLSEDLGIDTGGVINLFTAQGEPVSFLISGIFDLENETANKSVIFMDLNRAQRFFQMGSRISAIEIQIEDPFQSDTIAEEWNSRIPDTEIVDWKEQNQQLLIALSSQSSSTYTIQFFVILAVTLGISSVLAVSVVQKSKEIGILKAMGVTKNGASKIFLLQGFLLGAAGSLVGGILGILLIGLFQIAGLGAGVPEIHYRWGDMILIGVLATVSGSIASLLPARRSANLNPMEAIKNG